jgi:D-sedoheptulose 7-phosphate isomerase
MFSSYRNEVTNALKGIDPEKVQEAVDILRQARSRNACVFIVGNGGSAATASHFANDLLKVCDLRAFSLPDMTPTMLAYGNDLGWQTAFGSMLKVFLRPQDVLIAISCSGNSPNVVGAVQFAKSIERELLPGIKTIAMLGADEHSSISRLFPSVAIHVPYKDIRVQEDCHMVICHAIAGALSAQASA